MPTAADGDIIQVLYRMNLNLKSFTWSHHYFLRLNSFPEPELDDLYNAVIALFTDIGGAEAFLTSVLSEDVSVERMQVQDIFPLRYAKKEAAPLSATGGVAEAAQPQNVSAAITLRGNLTGRHYVGTKKMGGVPEPWVVAGRLTGPALVAYGDLGGFLTVPQTITVGGNAMGLDPCIFERSAPADSPLIYNYTVGLTSRTMHRRTVRSWQ